MALKVTPRSATRASRAKRTILRVALSTHGSEQVPNATTNAPVAGSCAALGARTTTRDELHEAAPVAAAGAGVGLGHGDDLPGHRRALVAATGKGSTGTEVPSAKVMTPAPAVRRRTES